MTWPVAVLQDLASDEPRAITDGPFGSNLARRHYTDAGPRVVRLQNIGDGRFIDAKAHISESHYRDLSAHIVLPGDLLVASLGQDLPRACLAPTQLGPAIVKADCIRVRLRADVDHRWVMYAMQVPSTRRWADQQLHGTGRPRLGMEVVRQIPVPLPDIAEQRRIVDILEDHFSRLDAADHYLSSVHRRAFALRRSALDQYFAADGARVALGELVTRIDAGRSFGGARGPAGPNEWGIVKVSAMTWGSFRPGENKAIPDARADPRYEIRQGDLLVSRANTSEYVGASVLVGRVRPRLLLSDKSLRLHLRPDVRPTWLWRVLQSPSVRRQISTMATGTKDSMRNISQGSLLRVEVPDISLQDQDAALDQFSEVETVLGEQYRAVSLARRRSDVLRRAVLAAAFSGQLTGRSTDDDVVEELAAVGSAE